MNRARPLLLLVAGAGTLLLSGMPAGATATGAAGVPSASAAEALDLLGSAAQAARSRSWSGTQYLAAWHDGVATSQVVEVRHDPRTGTWVGADSTAEASTAIPSAALDEHLLTQLADAYTLSVAGSGSCSGRRARVVEARRPDGRLAGRFWLDRDTGLPLQREVWDAQGNQLRSSAMVHLEVGPDLAGSPDAMRDVALVAPVRTAAWSAPVGLPGGYTLFQASRPVHDGVAVQHLAYSDGLSTVSLFNQPGSLGTAPPPGYQTVRFPGGTVWLRPGMPERVVWGGDGQVFTLVSDAGRRDLLAAVRVLPHDDAPAAGPLARLGRGLSRIQSWFS